MYNILRLVCFTVVLVLLVGCSTVENGVIGLFESINAANPLPEDYGKQKPPENNTPSSIQNKYSDDGLNSNDALGRKTSFEEWHNNQYQTNR